MNDTDLRPPQLRGTLGWTAVSLAAVPAVVAALWLVGAAAGDTGRLAGRMPISWAQVAVGAGTVAALSVLAAIVHTVRVARYRRARYRVAARDLAA